MYALPRRTIIGVVGTLRRSATTMAICNIDRSYLILYPEVVDYRIQDKTRCSLSCQEDLFGCTSRAPYVAAVSSAKWSRFR